MEEEQFEIKPRANRILKSEAARNRRKIVKEVRSTKIDREERDNYKEFDKMIKSWGKFS